jgi:diaminohydroxyphosphoribosylaminopyrimidine deaminase / 5-amino-6-(5-phosphoribosylamino)uracil reductase
MINEKYMQRCLQLAQLGCGNVAPNPMVGAVLVYEERIIGEGYHAEYGEAHAEVNCINSVTEKEKELIEKSTLYVSLEPCVHFGKTPPCTNLILQHKIPKVVIGCSDSFAEVNGKGIQQLKSNGVEVVCGVLENECRALNKRFFTFHTKQRPYVILKWAQSKNGKIAAENNNRVFISNDFTNRLVHKWRTQEAAIFVGTNTALQDNPLLTARLWQGKNPIRILLDESLKVPTTNNLFNTDAQTIVFNAEKGTIENNIHYYQLTSFTLPEILNALHSSNIQSVLVEGGAKLLQSFIDANLWDEIRVIENTELYIENGLHAPIINNSHLTKTENYLTDTISYYKPI